MPIRSRIAAPRAFGLLFIVFLVAGCGSGGTTSPASTAAATGPPARYTVNVVEQYPHDPEAFTQGLVWAGDGQLFESTGLRGQSTLRRVDISTGAVEQRVDLDPQYFGEGLALVDDRLIQLTWKDHTAFEYEAETFEQTETFDYSTEGWGLCHDGKRLVMSDGTSTLTFRDPTTFEPKGNMLVRLDGVPLAKLNELECVEDRVYANVLSDDNIYEIDPSSGRVIAVIDASRLSPESDRAQGDVLNGIAYDSESEQFYVTGKHWPSLYKVTFEPAG